MTIQSIQACGCELFLLALGRSILSACSFDYSSRLEAEIAPYGTSTLKKISVIHAGSFFCNFNAYFSLPHSSSIQKYLLQIPVLRFLQTGRFSLKWAVYGPFTLQ